MDQVPGCPLYSIENKFGVGGPGAELLGTSSLLHLQWRLCLLCISRFLGTYCNFAHIWGRFSFPTFGLYTVLGRSPHWM